MVSRGHLITQKDVKWSQRRNKKDVLTVNVAIVPVVMPDVGRANDNTMSPPFRGVVSFGIASELGASLAGKDLGDCSGPSGFTVIDMTCVGGQPEPVMGCPIDIPM